MQTRPLFKNGNHIPVIGFGAWPIGGGMGAVDETTAIATIHASIDYGITLIDTAQYYRTSEAIIGKALQQSGNRDRCFIATKVSFDYSAKGIREAMENSLRALQMDYVDLYQIHSWNAAYPIEESMQTLEQLQKEGKTRYIGVSNFSEEQMRLAAQTALFQSNQVVYNMIDRDIERAEIPYCEEHGIGILAHSPLAKGLLGGRYTLETRFAADDERSGFPRFQGEAFARYVALADELKGIARDKGLTLAQLAVSWTLCQPSVSCVLVGAKTPEQIEAFVAAGDVTWSDEDLRRVNEILGAF